MSAMKVMNRDAPRSAPRIGRKESERNSNRVSSHAFVPRGPLARSRALMSASLSPVPPPPDAAAPPPVPTPAIAGSAIISL